MSGLTTAQSMLLPFVLEPLFVERVWGANDLSPWYAKDKEATVGEVWLASHLCTVASGVWRGSSLADLVKSHRVPLLGTELHDFPLLIKMLFTADRLSVQVHPDDVLAASLGGDVRAKSECWYVLSAEPDASVALGFRESVSEIMVKQALGTASIESLLHYAPVVAGDMVNVPAGTIHAIGPGLVLLEVQQSSDTTYRLWDYGRPRELHLADGTRAIKLGAPSGRVEPRPLPNGGRELIATEHFIVERYELSARAPSLSMSTGGSPEVLIALHGTATITPEGESDSFRAELPQGCAAVIPASLRKYSAQGNGVVVRCRVPSAP